MFLWHCTSAMFLSTIFSFIFYQKVRNCILCSSKINRLKNQSFRGEKEEKEMKKESFHIFVLCLLHICFIYLLLRQSWLVSRFSSEVSNANASYYPFFILRQT